MEKAQASTKSGDERNRKDGNVSSGGFGVKSLAFALTVVLFVGTASTGGGEDKKIRTIFDATLMSQLMDNGEEYYGEEGGFLQSARIDLWGSGWGVEVGHRAATSGFEAKERYDYKVGYGQVLFAGQVHKLRAGIAWVYQHHNKGGHQYGDAREWSVNLDWSNRVPGGWVLSYQLSAEHGEGTGLSEADYCHSFKVSRDLKIASLPNPLNFYVDAAYRDSLDGITAWTHSTVGVSTALRLTENISVVPALNHQVSLSDLLTKDGVTYGSVSVQCLF